MQPAMAQAVRPAPANKKRSLSLSKAARAAPKPAPEPAADKAPAGPTSTKSEVEPSPRPSSKKPRTAAVAKAAVRTAAVLTFATLLLAAITAHPSMQGPAAQAQRDLAAQTLDALQHSTPNAAADVARLVNSISDHHHSQAPEGMQAPKVSVTQGFGAALPNGATLPAVAAGLVLFNFPVHAQHMWATDGSDNPYSWISNENAKRLLGMDVEMPKGSFFCRTGYNWGLLLRVLPTLINFLTTDATSVVMGPKSGGLLDSEDGTLKAKGMELLKALLVVVLKAGMTKALLVMSHAVFDAMHIVLKEMSAKSFIVEVPFLGTVVSVGVYFGVKFATDQVAGMLLTFKGPHPSTITYTTYGVAYAAAALAFASVFGTPLDISTARRVADSVVLLDQEIADAVDPATYPAWLDSKDEETRAQASKLEWMHPISVMRFLGEVVGISGPRPRKEWRGQSAGAKAAIKDYAYSHTSSTLRKRKEAGEKLTKEQDTIVVGFGEKMKKCFSKGVAVTSSVAKKKLREGQGLSKAEERALLKAQEGSEKGLISQRTRSLKNQAAKVGFCAIESLMKSSGANKGTLVKACTGECVAQWSVLKSKLTALNHFEDCDLDRETERMRKVREVHLVRLAPVLELGVSVEPSKCMVDEVLRVIASIDTPHLRGREAARATGRVQPALKELFVG